MEYLVVIKKGSGKFFYPMWIAQAQVPATSRLKRVQLKRDNPVISAAATTPSSDEE